MIFSESNTKIALALVGAWAEIENPRRNQSVKVKTKKGGEYDFKYADFSSILRVAKKVFKEHKLSIIQSASTDVVEGKSYATVETLVIHESGEYVKSEKLRSLVLGNMQDMGGQITYMKRYSLSAMLGISTDADDDGNFASGNVATPNNQNQQKKPKLATENQRQMIKDRVSEFAKLMGKEEIDVYGAIGSDEKPFVMDKLTTNDGAKVIELLNKWIKNAKEKQNNKTEAGE